MEETSLEDERLASLNETEWAKIQRRVVSMIRLVLAPEIKHNVLKEMELYQLKLEKGGELHDHINKFN